MLVSTPSTQPYGNQDCFSPNHVSTPSTQRDKISHSSTEPHASHEPEVTHQLGEPKTHPAPSRLQTRLKEIFNSPISHNILEIQRQMQEETNESKTMRVAESSVFQHSAVFITPSSVRVVDRILGQGGQGIVYGVNRLFNHSDTDLEEALKITSKEPASRRLLDEIHDLSPSAHLNVPSQSYRLKSSQGIQHCDILSRADSDFKKFDFTKIEKPIQCMLNFMKDVAQAADNLHRVDILHRDIKPENIFVVRKKGVFEAVLGDLDLIFKQQIKEHYTTCSPYYSHPSIWGNDLMKQANRIGLQTKADDVFSLGRTIQYGLIARIFANYAETKPCAANMRPRARQLKNENEVEEFVKSQILLSKIVIVISTQNIQEEKQPNQIKVIPKDILIFPSRNELDSENIKGKGLLKGKLALDEYKRLEIAVHLAHFLQRDQPNRRPSMSEIAQIIDFYKKDLRQTVPSSVAISPQRKHLLDDTDQCSQPSKRVNTGP